MLGKRIKKLILIRLLFGTLLLYCPKAFGEGTAISFYGAAAGICIMSGFYLLWYLTRRWYRYLALTQFYVDIGVVTYLVIVSGGVESVFVAFYVLSILSSALLLGDKKVVFQTTAVSCVAYLIAAILVHHEGLNPLAPRDPIYLGYGIGVRIAILAAVGRLSCYLSGTILELQNQLKLSERLSFLGEVVSKIAHEIRNPLSAIRTAGEVLQDSLQGKLSPQEERMITIISQESDRLTKTLQRILGYAKQSHPDPKVLLLEQVVERVLGMVKLHSQLHSNGVLVEKEYDKANTHIYADEEQIVGAFLNLTLNAYQAMPSGGIFKINAKEELGGTRVSFEDNGGGIPPDKVKELFFPFRSTKKGGTGLGLAEVHKIVTLHEGKINVESKPGKGTVFQLYFPKP